MNKSQTGALVLLTAILAADAGAQTGPSQCLSPAPSSVKKRVDAQLLKLRQGWKGDPNLLDTLEQRYRAAASQVWTCSKSTESTCCSIPLKVESVESSPTGCKYTVTFPYGDLRLDRTGGFIPTVVWYLDPTPTSPALLFGSKGIQVMKKPLKPLPVDSCQYDSGSLDRFKCTGTGKRFGKADHLANVYVSDHVDDPAWRCENLDPTITNTN